MLIDKSKTGSDRSEKLNSYASKNWLNHRKGRINYALNHSASARISNQYLPPLVVAAESEFIFERLVTLNPRGHDEEQTDELDEDIDE